MIDDVRLALVVLAAGVLIGACVDSGELRGAAASGDPLVAEPPPPEPTGERACRLSSIMRGTDALVVGTPAGDGERESVDVPVEEGVPAATVHYVRSHVEVAEVVSGRLVAEVADGRLEVVSYESVEHPDEPPLIYDDVRERVLPPGAEILYLMGNDRLENEGDLVRPRAAMLVSGDDYTFVGTGCAAPFQRAFSEATELLGMSQREFLFQWPDASELDSDLVVHLDAAVRERQLEEDRQLRDDQWFAADPLFRSLQPGDVPESVAASLKSVPVVVDLSDVGPERVLGVRSDSGVTLYVTLATTLDAYYTPADASIHLGQVSQVDTPRPVWDQTAVEVPISALAETAALLVTGSMDDPQLEYLSQPAYEAVISNGD
jgi:hypothetical protein